MKMLSGPVSVLQLEQSPATYDQLVDFARRNPNGHIMVTGKFMKIELMVSVTEAGEQSYSVRLRGIGGDQSLWVPCRPERPGQSFAAKGVKVILPTDDLLEKFGLPPNENLAIDKQERVSSAEVPASERNKRVENARTLFRKAAAVLLAVIGAR